jgi:hypothetical protein
MTSVMLRDLNTRVPNTKCESTLRRLGICLFCFVRCDHIVTLPNIGPSPCSTFGNVGKPLVRLDGHICHFTTFGPTKQKLLNLSDICVHGNWFKLLKKWIFHNWVSYELWNVTYMRKCIFYPAIYYSLIPKTICTRQMMKYLSFTFTRQMG